MYHRPALQTIGRPVPVVVGTRDRLTPPHLARALADHLPRAALVTLPDHGHMLPLEAPDELAEIIAQAGGTEKPPSMAAHEGLK